MGELIVASNGTRAIRFGICQRCLSTNVRTFTCHHGSCAYCRNCLYLGRVCRCDFLEERDITTPPETTELTMPFELALAQTRVANQLLAWWDDRKTGLVHAVCGAGKTEMTFPVIERVVNEGKRVLIVSPRKDVALEWVERLERAFTVPVTRRYGGGEKASIGMITVATAPLLLNLRHVFDYVLVDESDAFPFAFDVTLWRTILRVGKGVFVFITATPTVWQQMVSTVHLSRRYHGFDLPVPTLVKQTDERLFDFCRRHASKPRLLFVPTKPDLERYQKTLEDAGFTCRMVSAETEERTDALHWLQETKGIVLATSIWERGMTVRDVQVGVVESEHRLFSTRGLIQMAGRAGRKPDAPTGEVCFFYGERTFRQDLAIRAIQKANRR
ncbi:DEAD/DEAH box helicase family protein [Exiguobacterium aestuarii]|uniref:DEAD/DEAH box helicase family protein n=1 Tax=Exiguobacterium aestuarii TaxID=273527 RepID=A0ABW2PHZ6_9BACL|nr:MULTISPECIES: DEAD/DEAH box helicase family protein [Exiguobacterium]MCT4786510.1 helicase-related protein [Exiguobacterium aestuarii]